MRTKKKIIFLVIAAIIAVFWSVFIIWNHTSKNYSEKMESIVIGTPHNESSTLLYIAYDRQFFIANGLNITLRDFDFGALALNSMLRGEVNIALTTEFPFVNKVLRREKIRTIGSIGKFEFVYLVGRKDRGIEKISDLKGKRVSTARWTIAEFYLGRCLNLHGIKLKEIVLGDLQQSEKVADAVVNGSVDAVVNQEPYATEAAARLGANGVVLPIQSGQAMFAPLICRDEWIAENSQYVSRLLKSLLQAEEYAKKHPEEVEAILQKRLNLKPSYAKTVHLRNQLSLSLDQALLVAMEDEARWMIKHKLTTEKEVPDFLDYISEDGLKAIKPESINIIH